MLTSPISEVICYHTRYTLQEEKFNLNLNLAFLLILIPLIIIFLGISQ